MAPTVYMFVCGQKNLNRTLEIDSPIQTFVGGLLVKFIDWLYHYFLQKRFPHRVNPGFSYIICTFLYLSGWKVDAIITINKVVSIVIQQINYHHLQTRQQAESLRTGKE